MSSFPLNKGTNENKNFGNLENEEKRIMLLERDDTASSVNTEDTVPFNNLRGIMSSDEMLGTMQEDIGSDNVSFGEEYLPSSHNPLDNHSPLITDSTTHVDPPPQEQTFSKFKKSLYLDTPQESDLTDSPLKNLPAFLPPHRSDSGFSTHDGFGGMKSEREHSEDTIGVTTQGDTTMASRTSAITDLGWNPNRIRVVARIRPLLPHEKSAGLKANLCPTSPAVSTPRKAKNREKLVTGVPVEIPIPQSLTSMSNIAPLKIPKLTPRRENLREDNVYDPAPHDTPFTPTKTQNNTFTSGLAPVTPQSYNDNKTSNGIMLDDDPLNVYHYDCVFGKHCGQQEVYDVAVGGSVVSNIFRGMDTTVICYGQTGSGKTYTMGSAMGTGDEFGTQNRRTHYKNRFNAGSSVMSRSSYASRSRTGDFKSGVKAVQAAQTFKKLRKNKKLMMNLSQSGMRSPQYKLQATNKTPSRPPRHIISPSTSTSKLQTPTSFFTPKMSDSIKKNKASERHDVGNDSDYGINGFQSKIEDDEVSALDTDMNDETSTVCTVSSISQDDGICVRAIHDLFHAREEMDGECVIALTYLEVYNDEIHDLLRDDNPTLGLKIIDHGERIEVRDLKSIEVETAEDVVIHMKDAARRRTSHPTDINKYSSRSHAVCVIHVTTKGGRNITKKFSSTKKFVSAKLTLVDLAGSERIKRSGAEGIQKKESISINKDLFVLGKVISILAAQKPKVSSSFHDTLSMTGSIGGVSKASKRTTFADSHVPYRDSNLTRLLRDSLGGNCCTILIACLSPFNTNESVNTLKYAASTHNIHQKLSARKSSAIASPSETSALRNENRKLREILDELLEHQNSPLDDGRAAVNHYAAMLKKEQEIKQFAKIEASDLRGQKAKLTSDFESLTSQFNESRDTITNLRKKNKEIKREKELSQQLIKTLKSEQDLARRSELEKTKKNEQGNVRTQTQLRQQVDELQGKIKILSRFNDLRPDYSVSHASVQHKSVQVGGSFETKPKKKSFSESVVGKSKKISMEQGDAVTYHSSSESVQYATATSSNVRVGSKVKYSAKISRSTASGGFSSDDWDESAVDWDESAIVWNEGTVACVNEDGTYEIAFGASSTSIDDAKSVDISREVVNLNEIQVAVHANCNDHAEDCHAGSNDSLIDGEKEIQVALHGEASDIYLDGVKTGNITNVETTDSLSISPLQSVRYVKVKDMNRLLGQRVKYTTDECKTCFFGTVVSIHLNDTVSIVEDGDGVINDDTTKRDVSLHDIRVQLDAGKEALEAKGESIIEVGGRVRSQKNGNSEWVFGRVIGASADNTFDIKFDDGTEQKAVTRHDILVVESNIPFDILKQDVAELQHDSLDTNISQLNAGKEALEAQNEFIIEVGTRVMLQDNENSEWKNGKVISVSADNTYDIRLDDGTEQRAVTRHDILVVKSEIPLEIIKQDLVEPQHDPLGTNILQLDAGKDSLEVEDEFPIEVGTRVRSQLNGNSEWKYGRVICASADNTYDIKFDERTEQRAVKRHDIPVVKSNSTLDIVKQEDLPEAPHSKNNILGVSSQQIVLDNNDFDTSVNNIQTREGDASEVVLDNNNFDTSVNNIQIREGDAIEAQRSRDSVWTSGFVTQVKQSSNGKFIYDALLYNGEGLEELPSNSVRKFVVRDGSTHDATRAIGVGNSRVIAIGDCVEISFGRKLMASSGKVSRVYPTTVDVAYDADNSGSSIINVSKDSLAKRVDVENLSTAPLHLLLIREGDRVDVKLSDNGINDVIISRVAPDRVSCDIIFDHGDGKESVVGIPMHAIRKRNSCVENLNGTDAFFKSNSLASREFPLNIPAEALRKYTQGLREGDDVDTYHPNNSFSINAIVSSISANSTYEVIFPNGSQMCNLSSEVIRSHPSWTVLVHSDGQSLCSSFGTVNFGQGESIDVRLKNDPFWTSECIVARVLPDGTYDIQLPNGDIAQNCTKSALRKRIILQKNGLPPTIESSRLAKMNIPKCDNNKDIDVPCSHQHDYNNKLDSDHEGEADLSILAKGTQVEVNCNGERKKSGTVYRCHRNNTYDILYDDKTKERSAERQRISPLQSGVKERIFQKGDIVEARLGVVGEWTRGQIIRVHSSRTYDVQYDQGEIDIRLPVDIIRTVKSPVSSNATKFDKLDIAMDPELKVGRRVEFWYEGEERFQRGRICKVHYGQGLYDIFVDDGRKESEVKSDLIRKIEDRPVLLVGTKVVYQHRDGVIIAGRQRISSKDPGGTQLSPSSPPMIYDIKTYDNGEVVKNVQRPFLRVIDEPSYSNTVLLNGDTSHEIAADWGDEDTSQTAKNGFESDVCPSDASGGSSPVPLRGSKKKSKPKKRGNIVTKFFKKKDRKPGILVDNDAKLPVVTESIDLSKINTPVQTQPNNLNIVKNDRKTSPKAQVPRKPCMCESPLFRDNPSDTLFYLPKFCDCGKSDTETFQPTTSIPFPEQVPIVIDDSDPSNLNYVLRTWQASFLSSAEIHTAEDLIMGYNKNAKRLGKQMFLWWQKYDEKQIYKLRACYMALHIWARAAKVFLQRLGFDFSTFPIPIEGSSSLIGDFSFCTYDSDDEDDNVSL